MLKCFCKRKDFLMKKLNTAFFYLCFSVAVLGSAHVWAQVENTEDQNTQGNRVASDEGLLVNPIFADKPQVILFKIHDIKPVLDTEDNIVACDYTATFYNRTPINIRQAKIQLGWTDKVSERYLIENVGSEEPQTNENDDENQEEKAPEVQRQAGSVENLGTFRSTLMIPALGSLKQVSVQGQVDTDKCFVLFDNIQFNVSSCHILGQETMPDTRRGRVDADKDQLGCASLFAYVNSKHPEYYSEFKKISYEEQMEHEKTQEEQEKEMIQTIGKAISSNLDKTDSVLEEIK